MQIRLQPLDGSALARDYLQREPVASAFFSGSPFSLHSFRRKYDEVQARFGREERERAARALRPTSDRARQRLQRFVEHGGAMVTTGQQAGLLTGPLYTLYKALTTARLADHLETHLGVPVVPVFWTASEDHDWEEANHADLSLSSGGVVRVQLPPDTELPLPMSDRVLGEGVRAILDEVEQVVATQPYAEDVLKLIRGAYDASHTVAGAFSEMMARLLEPFDVCLTDAADPVVKAASAPLLRRALEEAAAHEGVLARRTAELEAAGYGGQVAVLEGATNVFYHGERGRVRLYYRDGTFRVPETGERFAAAALLARVEEAPERFSPNVFLRPIVESAVFPTLAYVAGPGEISYFGQITALFPEFGVLPPVVYPRASLTLVEPAMGRLLEKLNLSLEELQRPRHELVDEVARRSMPAEIREILDELARAVTDGYRRLMEVGSAVDPTLADALASLRNQVLARVEDSERKVVRQLKRREEIAIGQLDRARSNLCPEGAPQERVLNVVPFLARHGRELLRQVAEAIPVRLEEGASAE